MCESDAASEGGNEEVLGGWGEGLDEEKEGVLGREGILLGRGIEGWGMVE